MKKIQGMIFDLDGTLANTLDDLANAMNTVLASHQFPVFPIEAYNYFVGNGIRNLVQATLPEHERTEERIAQCYEEMIILYRDGCLRQTHLYDGIMELIKTLQRKNYSLAVFSNKADEMTQMIVEKLIGKRNFEIVFGAQPAIPRKPDPSGALLIGQRLGIEPQNMAYLGDTSTDMMTAARAGMFAIGALWGFRTETELVENGAQALARHPQDVLHILGER
ncbi:MAG TPA: HAD family hydrolase [Bacteroidota bacterium]|nr:HAD family hydrolase [Bacteroidota bacterium]